MSIPRWAALILVAIVSGGCVDRPEADASGAHIYTEVCASCHGLDLQGGAGPALGAGSNAAQQPDEFLIGAVRDGFGRMPSFAQTLTPEQIERVVQHLRDMQSES